MIVIPAWAWKAVLDTFSGAPGMVERVAFLDGVASGPATSDGGVVTTVTLPHADESEGHWDVSAREMSRAGRHLRPYGLVRLAQVHTHPGPWTVHSSEDDELAYSQVPGTVSIVLPAFGLTCPGLGDAGVHRRDRRGWRKLDHEEAARHVKVVPSAVDLRYA
jgi:proteasome lid subunit RPN8/RPN11